MHPFEHPPEIQKYILDCMCSYVYKVKPMPFWAKVLFYGSYILLMYLLVTRN